MPSKNVKMTYPYDQIFFKERERDGSWSSYFWKHLRAFEVPKKKKTCVHKQKQLDIGNSPKTHTKPPFFKHSFICQLPFVSLQCIYPTATRIVALLLQFSISITHFLLFVFSFLCSPVIYFISCLFLNSISNIVTFTFFSFFLLLLYPNIPCLFSKRHRYVFQIQKL